MKPRHIVLSLSILALAGLVLAAYAQKVGSTSSPGFTKGKRGEDGARLIRARENWFYRQRAYPLKRIPAFARLRAFNVMRQMEQKQVLHLQQKYGANYARMAAAAALATGTVNTAATWVPIGPQPSNDYFFQPYVSGRITAMVVDPCDSTGNTVFAGGAQGGLWLTTNGGSSWQPVGDQATMPSLAIGSIAVPPGCTGSSSTTVYLGTGEENFSYDSYYGAGVLKCTYTGGTSVYSCALPTGEKFGSYTIGSTPLSPDSAGPYIGSLAVDPKNSQILLAAVQAYQSVMPSGIWCSADGGTTWNHVLPSVTQVVGTGVAFDQAGYAYAALGDLDGGASEGTTTVNGVYKTSAAVTSCTSPAPAFSQLGGLGNLASPSSMGRIAISVASNPNAPSSASADEVFAAVADASNTSSTLLGVYASGNGGNTWQQLTNSLLVPGGGFCDDQCFYDLTINIDPHNPTVVFAGGSAPGSGANGQGNTLIGTSKASSIGSSSFTINAGSSWSDISGNDCSTCNTGMHVDLHAIAFAPAGTSGSATKVYVGTDGGAWSAASPESLPGSSSQTWTNLNSTLALTQIYPGMSNDPAGWEYRSYLGAQDNGSQLFGQESGTSNPLAWDNTLTCGDGGYTLVDPQVPSTVYNSCAYISGFILGIQKSLINGDADNTAGTTSYYEASTGINGNDAANFIPPMAIDSEKPQNLYFGTYRVYQSTDGANSWNAISPDVTGGGTGAPYNSFCSSNPGYCVLMSVAVAPTDSNEVVTGSDVGEVYLSLNAGSGSSSTWTDVTTSALPPRSITQVAVSPSNPNTIFATFSGFSGFNGDTAGHVFVGDVTTGTTPAVAWTDVSSATACVSGGALPNIPVDSIVVDPNNPSQLFVGTDLGVFLGELQGTAPLYTGGCWQPLSNGLPDMAALSLTLNNASRTLIAGTHGRSAWALALGDTSSFDLESLSPASASAGTSVTLVGQGLASGQTVNWQVNGSTPSGCSITVTSAGSTTTMTGQTANQLVTSVPAACMVNGVAQVSVTDPRTSTTTNSLPFTITSGTPTVNSISPSTAATGSTVPMTLSGTGFLSSTTLGLQDALGLYPCNPVSGTNTGTTQFNATIPSSCLQYGGYYFVTANNPQPGGGSSNPNLIAAPATYGTACTSENPPGCLLDVSGAAPPNDSFSGATTVTPSSSGSYSVTEDTSGATTSGSDPALPSTCTSSAADNGDANSVWFKYTPSANTTISADTIGSSYDTILSVWSGTSTSNLSSVACNDDIVSGINRVSEISDLTLSAGTTYYFMVTDWGIPIYNSTGTSLSNVIAGGGKLVFTVSTGVVPTASFTAKASTPSPSSITAGSSATSTLTLTPTSSSSTGTVTIEPCTTSSATITCSYSPSTINLGTSAAQSTVTIQTVAPGEVPPGGPYETPPLGLLVAFLAGISALVFLLRWRFARRRPVAARTGLVAALGFALLAATLIFEAACGGSGTPPSSTVTGTPPGTYTITIPTSPAATNGSATVTLKVQ